MIKKLEEKIDGLRDILSPVQTAKFILFANKSKYRKELNFFQEDELEVKGEPQKRVKL